MRCFNLWTRLRVSYAALFDPGISGSIGILPDSTAGLFRFKCVLTLIVVLMVVSALKPVYFGRFCHSFDRRIRGFFGVLPDSTAGLLRLKCVLAGITFRVMVSALEPD